MLEKQHEEKLQEYRRRTSSVVAVQSDKRAESPHIPQSEHHPKPALEEATRQSQLQGGAFTQQPLMPSTHQLPLYIAGHAQALGAAQYRSLSQGSLPPSALQPHLPWRGALSYQLPPQQHGSGALTQWPQDPQHSNVSLTQWPQDPQHSNVSLTQWPQDPQHSNVPLTQWPQDPQHGNVPLTQWPQDQISHVPGKQ